MGAANKQDYFQQGETWEAEVIQSLRSQRNAWVIVAIVALVLATVGVFAVMALTPLKRTEALIVEVDKASGKAEIVTAYDGDVRTISVKDQLAKYFINKYLVARESYFPTLDVEENYVLVQEFSEGAALNNYAKRFLADSPENPFIKYGSSTVKIKIVSISFLRDDTATVRYTLTVQKGQEADKVTSYIDILNYKFVNVPTEESARLKNPLGFKVTEYRSDIEIPN